ncbi:MAG TPA: hypothetical protein VFX84_00960 [Candidatus Saccharimonadales bacterium]|nr:hypothetical protein [Candidatus Saccharimonadales bacterium]
MRTALAEQLPQPNQTSNEGPHLYAVPEPEEVPAVIGAEDTEFEPQAVESHEAWLGSLAVAPSGEIREEAADINLLERTKAAKAGDPEARSWLNLNVDTAIFEAVFKKRYIGEVFMDRGPDGELQQFGQTNEDIHKNAVTLRPGRHPILEEITEAEGLNRHRIEKALAAGKLEDHYYLAFSLVPEDVPETELGPDGDGYFLDSLTLSLQATTETASGRVKTETAFMSGVEEQDGDGFEERLARRHDFKAVARVRERHGLKPLDTASEHLRGGFFVPKHMMPNGVADVMLWMDEAADEVLDREIERRPEDYAGIRLESKRKEASLKGVREKVVEDLFAAVEALKDPMESVQALWESVRQHATEDSFTNLHIDPKVFGRKAAADIDRAREHIRNGDDKAAQIYMQKAHDEAVVAGCGGGAGRARTARPESSEDLSHVAGEDEFGSLAFRCPDCGRINVRSEGVKVPTCWYSDCEADVSC